MDRIGRIKRTARSMIHDRQRRGLVEFTEFVGLVG